MGTQREGAISRGGTQPQTIDEQGPQRPPSPLAGSALECESALPPQTWADSAEYRHGIALFNQGRYFDAHEVLEDVWRPSTGESRKFLQGLIQVAVGLHHHSTGNATGAHSVLKRAAHNLAHYPADFGGIDLGEFRALLDAWRTSANRTPMQIRLRTNH